MASRRAAAVVVGTELRAGLVVLLGLLVAGSARADDGEAGDDDEAAEAGYGVPDLTSVELYFGWLEQRGHGWQSQAGPEGEPGSERATILQPMALFRLKSSANVRHTVVLPVDVVTSASADALDAVSSASYMNEAGTIDITTEIDHGDDTFAIYYGGHLEEPMRTAMWGAGWTRRLAEDNASFSLTTRASYDYFDNIDQEGFHDLQRTRAAMNVNLGFSQILSPTTLFLAGYGWTYQVGVLEQTWNAVPRAGEMPPLGERFPTERQRHAASARLLQHVPATRTTVKLGYRLYHDDFGIDAHTVEGRAYQYLGRAVIVRGLLRYHSQDGADFFMERFDDDMDMLAPRTADSDLAPLSAWHLGGQVSVLGDKLPWRRLAGHQLALGFEWYERSNDLAIRALTMSWAQEL
jgi:hypothetical protein